VCGAQELIDRLLEQAKPFKATFHLGQEVTEVKPLPDGRFRVATTAGTVLSAGAVVIAGGVGSFQPRRLSVPGIEELEGHGVQYRVRTAAEYHDRDLVICGGGDSALDWTVALCGKARSLTLVHRRAEFRAAPATVARMRELVSEGRMQLIEGNVAAVHSDRSADGVPRLTGVVVQSAGGRSTVQVHADRVLAFFGLHPKLGPIAEWGLELEKKALKVDTEKFQTSVPGISPSATSTCTPEKRS